MSNEWRGEMGHDDALDELEGLFGAGGSDATDAIPSDDAIDEAIQGFDDAEGNAFYAGMRFARYAMRYRQLAYSDEYTCRCDVSDPERRAPGTWVCADCGDALVGDDNPTYDTVVTRFRPDMSERGTAHVGYMDEHDNAHTACGYEWAVINGIGVVKSTYTADIETTTPGANLCGNCPWDEHMPDGGDDA